MTGDNRSHGDSADPVTRRNPEMEKYVTISPVVMDGSPDAHNVFLQVTNQQFHIGHACETKEDAEWTRDMLCVALAKVVRDYSETAPNPSK